MRLIILFLLIVVSGVSGGCCGLLAPGVAGREMLGCAVLVRVSLRVPIVSTDVSGFLRFQERCIPIDLIHEIKRSYLFLAAPDALLCRHP